MQPGLDSDFFVAVLFCLRRSRPTHALPSPLLLANTVVAGATGRWLADRGTPAVTLDKFARRPWGRMSTVGTLTSFEGGSVEIVRFFFIFPFLSKPHMCCSQSASARGGAAPWLRRRLADASVIVGGGGNAHPPASGPRAAPVAVQQTTAVHRPPRDVALSPERATGGTPRPRGRPADAGVIGGGGDVQRGSPCQRPKRAAPPGASLVPPGGEFLPVPPFFDGVALGNNG